MERKGLRLHRSFPEIIILAVAETSRRMAAKSLKKRVFLDIFEFMFDVT